MENVIEKLRELEAKVDESLYGSSVGDETWFEIEAILDVYKPEGYEVEKVSVQYDEGGRWTTEKSVVTKVTQADGEVAYFELWREEPATEQQVGMDFSFEFFEVVPKEVTVTKYIAKRSE